MFSSLLGNRTATGSDPVWLDGPEQHPDVEISDRYATGEWAKHASPDDRGGRQDRAICNRLEVWVS